MSAKKAKKKKHPARPAKEPSALELKVSELSAKADSFRAAIAARAGKGAAPAAVFFAAFAWLLYCAAPTLYWGDSAELVSVSCNLGVAHSPGYPLFTQLSRLFALLPFDEFPFRANVMSALLTALAATMLYIAVVRMSRSVFAGLVTLAALAGCRSFVHFGLIAEVYAAHAALFAGVILLLAIDRSRGSRPLVSGALLLIFLGFTHHLLMAFALGAAIIHLALLPGHRWRALAGPLLILFGAAMINLFRAFDAVPALTQYAVWALAAIGAAYAGYLVFIGLKRKGLVRFISGALALLAAAAAVSLVFAYLPLASARGPVSDWWGPRNPVNFLNLLFLQGYESTLPADKMELLKRVNIKMFLGQMSPAMMALGLPGLVLLFRKDWRSTLFAFLCGAGALAGSLLISHGKPDALRVQLFIVMSLFAGAGAAAVVGWRPLRGALWKAPFRLAAAALILFIVGVNLTGADRRHMNRAGGARILGEAIIDDVRSNSVVFIGTQTPGIMGYFRACEGDIFKRREITVVPVSFLPFKWELDRLRRHYPDVIFPDTFLFEEEKPVFRVDDPARARYAVELMRANPSRAFYSDFLFIPLEMDYRTVPRGAVYRIAPGDISPDEIDSMLEADATPQWKAFGGSPRYISLDDSSAVNISSIHNERGKIYLDYGAQTGDQKYFRTALKEFNLALKYDPLNSKALSNKGHCQFYFGQREKGLELMRKALKLDPLDPQLHEALATVLFRQQTQKSISEAVALWTTAFALDPYNSRALHNIAGALVALGQRDAAIQYYEAASNLDPYYASPYINLARIYNQMGACSKAVEVLDHAKEKRRDMLWLRIEIAEQYYNCRLQHLYAREVEEIMAEFDRDLELLYALAILFRNVGQHDNFARAVREIRDIDPEFPLQKFYSSLDCERAVTVLSELVKRIPDEPQLFLSLAISYGNCDEPDQAISTLRGAARRFPTHREQFNILIDRATNPGQPASSDPYQPFIEN
ncbi:MAG TPA: DUF2723 domain-containing protein [bacterium]|nr:DUF2723 domain-containing protein [bacterium]